MNHRLTRWVLAALMAYPALLLTQGAVQAAAPQPAKTAVVQSRAAAPSAGKAAFQAGPGIAVVQTTGGRVQGYVR